MASTAPIPRLSTTGSARPVIAAASYSRCSTTDGARPVTAAAPNLPGLISPVLPSLSCHQRPSDEEAVQEQQRQRGVPGCGQDA